MPRLRDFLMLPVVIAVGALIGLLVGTVLESIDAKPQQAGAVLELWHNGEKIGEWASPTGEVTVTIDEHGRVQP